MGPQNKTFLDRAPKRVRTEARTLDVPEVVTPQYPKFLVLHSETEKPLSKLSPFLVAKTLEGVVGKTFEAKKMTSGDLLVEVHTKLQSDALLALNSVSDYKVTVTPHRTLNTVQGVISEDDLLETPEAEIVEGLSSQGVIAARRITLRRDGMEHKTKHIVLTFAMTTLPQAVKAGYLHCRVRPYVPNPQRCFKCQRFGHGSRSCRGSDTCARCSSKEHLADHCENDPKCTNCEGKHAAYSRSCSLWKQEKEILTLKVQENIPYHEAKKRVLFASRGSYAEAVRRGPARPMVSTGTQTSADDLRVPSGSPSTSGVVRQTPPPSTRKDVGVPTPSKEQGLATLAPPTALPPKGRGVTPRPSGTQRIPGLPTKPAASKGQPLATTTDEPMDQSGLKSDEDRSMSGSECSLPGTGGSTSEQKGATRKKNTPRMKIDFKT
ncbi:unnamed protein product [Ixodes persulcatus]